MKLTICMGLPASGKSTWALQQKGAYVNRESIRKIKLPEGQWTTQKELEIILPEETKIICDALRASQDVIVDSTNFAQERRLRNIAAQFGAEVEVKYFDLPVQDCIARDSMRGPHAVGAHVIERMAVQFADVILCKTLTPTTNLRNRARAIICDLDGTLALCHHRSVYDHAKAGKDLLNEPIADMLAAYAASGDRVLIVSTRDEDVRLLTIQWLDDHMVHWDDIFLRPHGDTRRDALVKYELFNKYIRDQFYVRFVLDDRTRVVNMWRALGLTCLQVANGDY